MGRRRGGLNRDLGLRVWNTVTSLAPHMAARLGAFPKPLWNWVRPAWEVAQVARRGGTQASQVRANHWAEVEGRGAGAGVTLSSEASNGAASKLHPGSSAQVYAAWRRRAVSQGKCRLGTRVSAAALGSSRGACWGIGGRRMAAPSLGRARSPSTQVPWRVSQFQGSWLCALVLMSLPQCLS